MFLEREKQTPALMIHLLVRIFHKKVNNLVMSRASGTSARICRAKPGQQLDSLSRGHNVCKRTDSSATEGYVYQDIGIEWEDHETEEETD